ncbi:MAG: CopZ family metallochaperone [Syntrophomonadaceae bacterium]|jgi:copper chaperone
MSTIIQIAGMSCNHCKMAVEKALQAVPGVEKVQVDLEKKQAVIEGKANRQELVKAIEETGYEVIS